MKNAIKYALAILSPAILLSCQKEVAQTVGNDDPEYRTVTLTCQIADTKVSIDGTGKTAWEVGDKIYVHGELGQDANKGQIVTLTAEDIHDGGKTATLTFSEENVPAYERTDGCVSTRYACYPADAVDPAWSMFYYGIYKKTNVPIMQGYDDGNGNMIFHNLSAVISFEVSGDFDSYVFSGNNGEEVGYTHVAARTALYSESLMFDIPNDSQLHETEKNSEPLTTLSGSVVSNGTTSNYIYIFNGANFTDGFTIKFYKLGVLKKKVSTHTAINLARSQYKNLGDVTSYLKDDTSTPDPVPTISITIDGNMSDWSEVAPFYKNSGNSRVRECRFASDESNIYLYFVLRKNRVDSAKTLYIGFDTDKDSGTGSLHGNIAGCECYVSCVPFTNVGEATTPVPVDGYDSSSAVVAGSTTNGVVYCKAYDDGSSLSSSSNNIWLELSIPRDKLSLPASGSIDIGCSYDWYTTDVASVVLN